MISDELLAGLRPGDFVELHRQGWADDVVVRGTVRGATCIGELYLGDYSLTSATDQAPEWLSFPGSTLTVISRAPRPLYVNHARTEPLMNDVARIPGESYTSRIWIFDGFDWWFPNGDTVVMVTTDDMPKPMRLLVDGETGQVVP